MSDEKDTRGVNPPYISQNVWKPFFERMQRVNQPKDLSAQTLKEFGFSQGPHLKSALTFLGLVNDDAVPTDKFKLIQVQGDQFKKNLADVIRSAYHDLLSKHPLDHAKYEDIVNYFSQKYSTASAKKMAKSFGVLCRQAGLDSPAFTKMRSMEVLERQPKQAGASKEANSERRDENKPKKLESVKPPPVSHDDLVREFIKSNPMPTGVQWDAGTLKAYFEEYRATLSMLRDDESES